MRGCDGGRRTSGGGPSHSWFLSHILNTTSSSSPFSLPTAHLRNGRMPAVPRLPVTGDGLLGGGLRRLTGASSLDGRGASVLELQGALPAV